MSIFPDRSDREGQKAYDAKVGSDSAALRGAAEFYLAMATLEEMDAEAWFSGNKDSSLQKIEEALQHFKQSEEHFSFAGGACKSYLEWMSEDRKGEVKPDIKYLDSMSQLISDIITSLGKQDLPSLELIHTVSSSIRNEMMVAERKSLTFRGNRGHFPSE